MHEATDDWALGPYCGEIFTPRLLLSSESFKYIYQRICIFEEDSCIGNVFFKFEPSCCIGEVCESVDKAAVVGASTDACMK